MNKPTHWQHVLGCPGGLTACAIVFGILGFEVWQGRAPLPLAVAAWVLLVVAGNANKKLKEFENWERDWNAMRDPRREDGR